MVQWIGLEPIIAKILLHRDIYNRQTARVNHPTASIFPPYANLASRLDLLLLQLASNAPSLAESLSVNVDSCLNDCGHGSTNDIQG